VSLAKPPAPRLTGRCRARFCVFAQVIVVCLAVLSASCSSDRPSFDTLIKVVVLADGDLAALDNLQITISKEGESAPQLRTAARAGSSVMASPEYVIQDFPFEFPVAPGVRGPDGSVSIELRAFSEDSERLGGARAEVTGFREGEVVVLVMRLTTDCTNGLLACTDAPACTDCDDCVRQPIDIDALSSSAEPPCIALEADGGEVLQLGLHADRGDGGEITDLQKRIRNGLGEQHRRFGRSRLRAHGLEVAAIRGPVQRGRSVGLRRIDIEVGGDRDDRLGLGNARRQ